MRMCTFANARAYTFVDERKQVYKKLVVSEDGTRLLGGILVGDADDYGIWLQMMLDGTTLPEHPEEMIVPACRRQQNEPAARRRRAARERADLLLQQRQQGRDLRRDRGRLHDARRAEERDEGRDLLRRLQLAASRRS